MQTEAHAQPASAFPEMETPEFKAKADALIASEQAAFDAWLAEDKFDDLITGAKGEAMIAYKDAVERPGLDPEKSTWLEIDIGHRRARPLVEALHAQNIGFVEIQAWSWYINADHILGKRRRGHRGADSQNHAAVEAFAVALSRPGFEVRITRE